MLDNILPRSIFIIKINLHIRFHTFVIYCCCIWTGKELAGDASQHTCIGETIREYFAIVRGREGGGSADDSADMVVASQGKEHTRTAESAFAHDEDHLAFK